MKLFKSLLISAMLVTTLPALAHDEGHGPKLADTGKFGGLVGPVVEKKDAGLGAKAKVQYKAELVRSPDGKVQVYVYDAEMKATDASKWSKKAVATAAPRKKGLKAKTFDVQFDGKAFVGQLPEGLKKPFSLEFVFTENNRELLSAFDNQD